MDNVKFINIIVFIVIIMFFILSLNINFNNSYKEQKINNEIYLKKNI
jgi:preprotein translocase subunit SecG